MTRLWQTLIAALSMLLGLLDLMISATTWLQHGGLIQVVMFIAGLVLLGYGTTLLRKWWPM